VASSVLGVNYDDPRKKKGELTVKSWGMVKVKGAH